MSSDIYSAFGNKVRTKLILCLSNKPKNVTELISICGMSQSSISQHLTKLRNVGVLVTKRNGKEILYSVKYKKAIKVSQLLVSLENEMS